jgi:hypothetical protein
MRVKASVNSSSVINLATMFSYPPRPWIPTCNNLVSDGSGSASTMSVQLGVGIGIEQQIVIGSGATFVVSTGGGPRVVGRQRMGIMIRLRHRLKSRGGFSAGAIGTSTSAGVERVEVKADKKVQTLLIEVVRHYDSILEALGDTEGGGGGVILGASGGINTISMSGDTARDNIGTGDDGIGSSVLDTGVGVVLASDAAGGGGGTLPNPNPSTTL